MFKILHQIWHTKTLRNRILFTLFIVLVFRLLAHIPVPGANLESLATVMDRNKILGVFSVLTGGGLEQFSIVLMGISPYITASIILQLLTVVLPKLEQLSKEGEQGQRVINRYTRYLTVPLAFIQSYGMIRLLNSSSSQVGETIISDMSVSNILFTMLVLTAGTMLLMWLGEIISEDGIGNGISILIFAGIVANIPTLLGPALGLAQENTSNLIPLVGIVIFTLILTYIVILFTEGQRQIPITYAGRTLPGSSFSHLPVRINQAGMIPIIFAVSLMALPNLIASFFLDARTDWIRNLANTIYAQFNEGGFLYVSLYFMLVVVFTFFYVSITFNPEKVADNIQRRSGFIPGIRPGKETAAYLQKVSSRITLFGALFLAFVAVMPIIVQNFASNAAANIPMLISGAGLIIIVGVVLEVIRQINAQLVMQDYDKLY
jgi:preprotein translocase subunit SecY